MIEENKQNTTHSKSEFKLAGQRSMARQASPPISFGVTATETNSAGQFSQVQSDAVDATQLYL
jgi:hypothetical protein